MNYSEVKKELKKEFENLLKPLGYKSKSESQGCEFSLTKDIQFFRLGFGVANYIDEFKTSCSIGLGIFPVQKILFNALDEIPIIPNDYGSTLGVRISDYFGETNYNYKIKTQEDIVEWGKIVTKFYQEYAVPFFEKYNSVDAIDKLLNENPAEKVIYCDDLGWRIIKGLISAKLNQNSKYNYLRDYYKGEVESKFQGYFMYEKCMKVIDFLDSHSFEELNKIAGINQNIVKTELEKKLEELIILLKNSNKPAYQFFENIKAELETSNKQEALNKLKTSFAITQYAHFNFNEEKLLDEIIEIASL
ncbi:hypothetical protein [Flavobacterium sp. IMCC34518]|uniref:hypothetical protein n=1 Tax=Flavobacterium sp. IMCC34518 TaxID=3003623 RepID=UPI002482EA33|nr:hypothetical protein [Flavobacterium sp. IMCC34518]